MSKTVTWKRFSSTTMSFASSSATFPSGATFFYGSAASIVNWGGGVNTNLETKEKKAGKTLKELIKLSL